MKKLIIILITLLALILTSCDVLYDVLEAVVEESASQEEKDQSFELASEDTAKQTNEYAPTLPDADFSEMDFFDDGYEVVTFIRVTDGDTASFEMGGLNVKCRFVGVNTPEIDHENGNHEPFAEAARDFTENALKNADVIILERDKQAGEYDNYDRLLAHVWVDGEHLGYLLIKNGLATTKYYRDYYKYAEYVFYAQDFAGSNDIGLWSD